MYIANELLIESLRDRRLHQMLQYRLVKRRKDKFPSFRRLYKLKESPDRTLLLALQVSWVTHTRFLHFPSLRLKNPS
jgi:hypothetical protein